MTFPQNINGVDVAKNWINVFYLATAKEHRIAMTKQMLARFSKAAKGCLVVLEASIGYERPLTEALTRFKADFCLVNPRHAREYARATGKLAKYRPGRRRNAGADGLGAGTATDPTDTARTGGTGARRDDMVAMIGAERNRLGQSHNDWIRTQITSHINGMVWHRKAVEAEISKLTAALKALTAGSLRPQSMPGIGPTIAALIQARLSEMCQLDRRKLANLAGLAPHATESGQHRGKRRICGGRADLPRSPYLAGFVASCCDPSQSRR